MDGHPMRKMNGKLFLLLLLGGVVTVVTAAVVHHFQYGRIARALLWQARQAEEQGQLKRSAEYLQRYLEFKPRDLEEKARLARIWAGDAYPAGSRARSNAVGLLDEVLTYEDDPELRRLLVKTALEVGDFRRAREHLGKVLPWENDKLKRQIENVRLHQERGVPLSEEVARVDRAEGELELFWGQLHEQEKKPADAINCYRLATRHSPDRPEPYVRLAYMLRRAQPGNVSDRKSRHKEADSAMEEMVRRNADNCDAFLSRWRYRREFDLMAIRETVGRGNDDLTLEQAAQDVNEAIKRRPDSIEVLLAAADLERLRGRSAAEAFDRPSDRRLEEMQRHREKALAHLQRGLTLASQNRSSANEYAEFQLLWHKGNLLLDNLELLRMQNPNEAAKAERFKPLEEEIAAVVEQVRKTHMPAAADYMSGRLQINEGQWAEAVTLFERARTQMAGQRDLACQANLYLGQCYERLKEHAQMFSAFKRVTDEDPNAVPAILGKAAARWAQGKLDEAMAEYNIARAQKALPPRAWLDMARLDIQRQGGKARPDYKDAESALKEAASALKDDNIEVVLLRAEIAFRQNDTARARQVLEAGRKARPGEIEFLTALVDLALHEKNVDQAQALIAGARKNFPDQVGLRLAEARVSVAVQGKKSVQRLVDLGENRDKFNDDDQGRLLSGLADNLYKLEAVGEARKMWQRLTSLYKYKTDLGLRMLLFDMAMKESDEAGMQQTLEDIKAIEKDAGVYARYGEALYLIWQARQSDKARAEQLTRARENLDAVQSQRPAWPAIFLARAEIAELNGAPEQAIKELNDAIKNGDNTPTVIRRLVKLYTDSGRDNEAQVMLGKLQESLLRDTELGRIATQLYLRKGDLTSAIDAMHRAVSEDTKDVRQLIWTGRVLAAAQRRDEAEKQFRAAIQMGEAEPEAWVALVQFLATQPKRQADAKEAVARMRKKVPAKQMPLALARCQDALGNTKQAAKSYEKVLASKEAQDDPALVKAVALGHLMANRALLAEPLLRRLAMSEVRGTPPADIDWAKRNLALLLSGGTSYVRFKEALEMVGLKLDSEGRLPGELPTTTNTEMRRVQARVLAAQNQKPFRQHAIKILEELSRAKALTPDDEFILAMLYDADGNLKKAQERLKSLVNSKARTPHYMAQYAMSLIVQSPTPAALDEAETVIAGLKEAEKQREVHANSYASVELEARLLEARHQGDEAVALLRKHLEREGARPEESLLLVASLSRQKRYAEALELSERLWDEGKIIPEALGAVTVSLLKVMKPTDAQIDQVRKRLVAAQKKKPEATVLLLHLADLYDRQGNYDMAIENYQKVHVAEPNNVVALNNLAWLLAHRGGENPDPKALVYIDKAIHGMGRRPDLLDTRGMVYLAAGETTKALEDLKEATAEAPTPARLFHLAKALHVEKNSTGARKALREAKNKGLQATNLHPVEQQACRKLLDEYGFR